MERKKKRGIRKRHTRGEPGFFKNKRERWRPKTKRMKEKGDVSPPFGCGKPTWSQDRGRQ